MRSSAGAPPFSVAASSPPQAANADMASASSTTSATATSGDVTPPLSHLPDSLITISSV